MIKFVGKITDLKPMGFTFHKLYAMNYKAYRHEDTQMLIWVAGREVIFHNLAGEFLEIVFDKIINNEYPIYEETIYWKTATGHNTKNVFFDKGAPKLCFIDKETKELISHHDFMAKWKPIYPDYEKYIHFSNSGRFEEVIMHKRHLDMIKLMHSKGMLKKVGKDIK